MTTVKTAITERADLFKKREARGRRVGISRSQFFAQAAEQFLENNRNRRLRQQIDEAHADGLLPEEEDLLRAIKGRQRTLIEGEW